MREQFVDRADAGKILAGLLGARRGEPGLVVLALPRGGVPVAAEVARALGAELDVVVVRKLGVPRQPELAMGAIASGGVAFVNDDMIGWAGIDDDELRGVIRDELAELRRRERLYRGTTDAIPLEGRNVILVDDGLATGASMRVAIQAARRRGAARVTVAVPVGSGQAVAELGALADEVVCVLSPEPFVAVGYWYRDFAQTTDADVQELLAQFRPVRGAVA